MRVPGIYVPVKADVDQFNADMHRIKRVAQESARDISNSMDNALSHGEVEKSFNQLTDSLGRLTAAGKAAANQGVKPVAVELGELQQRVGVSADKWRELQARMLDTRQMKAAESALKSLKRSLRMDDVEALDFAKSFGLAGAGSTVTAYGSTLRSQMENASRSVAMVGEAAGLSKTQLASLQAQAHRGVETRVKSDALRRLAEDARLSATQIQELERQLGVTMARGESSAKRFGDVFANIGLYGGVYMAVSTVQRLGDAAFQSALQLERLRLTLEGVYGAGAGEQWDYLVATANAMGKGIAEMSRAYVRFAAAAELVGVSTEETRRIFEATTKALTKVGGGSEDVAGALRALEQMYSKGTVSSEEFRLQFGERIPGAMKMGADAMGLTTAEFQDLMKHGGVVATDFLPRLAGELEKFAQGWEKAAQSTESNIQRMKNEFALLSDAVIDLQEVAGAVSLVTDSLHAMRGAAEGHAAMQRLREEIDAGRMSMEEWERNNGRWHDIFTSLIPGFGGMVGGLFVDAEQANKALADATEDHATKIKNLEGVHRDYRKLLRDPVAMDLDASEVEDAYQQLDEIQALLNKFTGSSHVVRLDFQADLGPVYAAQAAVEKIYADSAQAKRLATEAQLSAAQADQTKATAYVGELQSKMAAMRQGPTDIISRMAEGGVTKELQKTSEYLEKLPYAIERYNQELQAQAKEAIKTEGAMADLEKRYDGVAVSHLSNAERAAHAEGAKAAAIADASRALEEGLISQENYALRVKAAEGAYASFMDSLTKKASGRGGKSMGQRDAERDAQEILRIQEDLTGDIQRLTLDEYDYKEWALRKEIDDIRSRDAVLRASAEDRAEIERQLQQRLTLELEAMAAERAEALAAETERAAEEANRVLAARLDARAALAELTGDVDGYYDARVEALRLEQQAAETAEERQLIEAQINQLLAERNLDAGALMAQGVAQEALSAHQELAEAYRDLPGDVWDSLEGNALSAFDAIIDGSKDAREAFQDFALGVVKDLAHMLAEIAMMQLKESIFGALTGGSGGGAGGGGFDLFGGLSDLFSSGSSSVAATAAATPWSTGGFNATSTSALNYGDAVANGVGAGGGFMASASTLSTLGTALGVIGLVGGLVGGLVSLFGEEKEEEPKLPQPLYNGTSMLFSEGTVSSVSGTYMDDGTVKLHMPTPDEVKNTQETWRQRFRDMEDAMDVLQLDFDANWRRTFNHFTGMMHEDLVGWAALSSEGAAARHALGDLTGAVEFFGETAESSAETLIRLAKALGTAGAATGAAGVDLERMAGVTERVLASLAGYAAETEPLLYAINTQEGIFTGAIKGIDAWGDAISDSTAYLEEHREALQLLAQADYADMLMEAVGGEDAFDAAMALFSERTMAARELAGESIEYFLEEFAKGAEDAAVMFPGMDAAAFGDSTEAFWAAYAAAMQQAMPPSHFSWWADMANMVAALDDAQQEAAQIDWESFQFEQEMAARQALAQGRETEAAQIERLVEREEELADARARGASLADQLLLVETQIVELEAELRAAMGLAPLRSAYDDAIEKLTNSVQAQRAAIEEERQEAEAMAAAFKRVAESLQALIDELTLDETLSPYAPGARLEFATGRFEALYGQALGGDLDAMEDMGDAARGLLDTAQAAMGSMWDYDALFASTIKKLSDIQGGAATQASVETIAAAMADAQTTVLDIMEDTLTSGNPQAGLLADANELLGILKQTGDSQVDALNAWIDATMTEHGSILTMGEAGGQNASGTAGLILAAADALAALQEEQGAAADIQIGLSEQQLAELAHIRDNTVPPEEWAGYIDIIGEGQQEYVDLLQQQLDERRVEAERLRLQMDEQNRLAAQMLHFFDALGDYLLQQTEIERYESLIERQLQEAQMASQNANFAMMMGVPAMTEIWLQDFVVIMDEVARLEGQLAALTSQTFEFPDFSEYADYDPAAVSESVTLPAMAAGGVVTGPVTALIGEAGPEMVLPLDQFTNSQDSQQKTLHAILKRLEAIEANTHSTAWHTNDTKTQLKRANLFAERAQQ